MQNIQVTIHHKAGLHARPAALFVQTANKFKSNLRVVKDEYEANAKSILAVLGLGASQGTVVKLIADGEDETQAIEAMRSLIESDFGEKSA